jgi:hypothetical protein
MCTENYWTDIVETNHDPRGDFEKWRTPREQKWKRKLGLPLNAPKWLVWRVTTKPPGPVNRDFTREARNKMNRTLRNAIAHGVDFDDLIIESRPSRLDARKWWY